MQTKREKIRFQQKKGRPPISREEAEYWLDFLPKVLKIGTEFEINLPSPREKLQRAENMKPCVHYNRPCSQDCSNLETCLVDRHPALCSTRNTGKFLNKDFACPAKADDDVSKCATCTGWMLNCRGLDCAMHTPFCTTCPAFTRKGETVETADIRIDAESVRAEMRQLLNPTESVGKVGPSGVLEITKDNSLVNNGGIEVPTVGRRVHWQSFYNMCKGIIDPIVKRGGYVNERCGQHYHVLAGYFAGTHGMGKSISELEKPLPESVLANLHQLNRRYELALFWIMSAGDSIETLTRWSRFRQSLRRFSALQSRMQKVQAEMGEVVVGMNSASNQKGKYASVAYHFCRFDERGDATTFHIENRIADGVLSPAVATAWAMLCYALVLKAVRLSQYGIMEIGSKEYRDKVNEVYPHIIDGENREWGDYRKADTSGIAPHIPWLQDNSRELINWLKPELSNMGPSYEILMSLVERPCSIRLSEGQTWEQIETDLYSQYSNRLETEYSINEDEVRELVDLSSIVGCQDLEHWIEEVAGHLGKEPNAVAEVVNNMMELRKLRWSDPIGTLITA